MSTVRSFRLRARLVRAIRQFFAQRGVEEALTPATTTCGVTDVHIESVALAPGGYLRTSPEYAHKRLLAAGAGDLYELGPVFRAGEHGRLHRTEFTLLEWYRVGWTWSRLADEVLDLVEMLTPGRRWHRRIVPWRDLMGEELGLDPAGACVDELRRLASDAPAGLERPELFDWLFATRVQPTLPLDQLTVVHDYPACQAALARLRPDAPEWAERFEVFAGTLELANGYRELTDATAQRQRFEADNRRRRELGRSSMPIDERLIDALQTGLPECSGVALGFDRLAMVAADTDDIGDVEMFP
ncbi:MAG: EF-P lysine aminoacylase EpmA [Candidatus Wenzhouxiangella sp. M2_3B_020]